MNNLYIHHHLGLGDFFICNGLVRHFIKPNQTISLFCKIHNVPNVEFMYRDEPSIKLIPVTDDQDVDEYRDVIRIGFEYSYMLMNQERISWDESFYKQLAVDFKIRWDGFFVQRDRAREEALVKKLNPDNRPIALIHGVGSDGINRLNENIVSQDLFKIHIQKGNTENVFDYLGLMDEAKEIHCIDSSFKHLFDSYKLDGKRLFYHDSNRRANVFHKSRNKWTEV